MLYGLRFVPNHPVYRLQEAVEHFLFTGTQHVPFGGKCFPDWFDSVFSNCSSLRQRAQTVYRLMNSASPAIRQQVKAIWISHNKVQALCDDKQCRIRKLQSGSTALDVALTDLFRYLFDDIFENKSFVSAVGGRSIDDHYIAFRRLGQRVCPFCGIDNYIDRGGGSRSAYDHYLARSIYPLASVNFFNLVPMCDICNRRPNKGTKNVLFTDAERPRRRRVFYPYGPVGGVRVSLSLAKRPALNFGGEWTVKIRPKKQGEIDKIQTWLSIFNIPKRFGGRLAEEHAIWTCDFLRHRQYSQRPDLRALRRDFKREARELANTTMLENKSESALQGAFFQFLATRADPAFVRSLAQTANSAFITSTAITSIRRSKSI